MERTIIQYQLPDGSIVNGVRGVANALEIGKTTVRTLIRKGVVKKLEQMQDSNENKESTRLTIKRFGEV